MIKRVGGIISLLCAILWMIFSVFVIIKMFTGTYGPDNLNWLQDLVGYYGLSTVLLLGWIVGLSMFISESDTQEQQ